MAEKLRPELEHRQGSPLLVFDFETFFDPDAGYSLKNLSMEAYIRDPRFEFQCVGVKRPGYPAASVEGHKQVVSFMQALPVHRLIMVAHNAPFDGLALSHHCNVRPRMLLDTQAMAKLAFGNALESRSLKNLTELLLPGMAKDSTALMDIAGKRILTVAEMRALRDYCEMDCELTYQLFLKLAPLLSENRQNLELVDLVTRMFSDPVLELDEVTLNQTIAHEMVEKQKALAESGATNITQLRSNTQFAALLRGLGVEPPQKLSETTGQLTYSFSKSDREFEALLRHEDERVRKLVAARLRCKTSIEETRAQSYLEVAQRGTWPVHLEISGAATTHRLSGGNGGGGNPQNLGKKSSLRAAIKPPVGFKILAGDSSNIELRVAMTLAQEAAVVRQLRDPSSDAYKSFATRIYGKDEADITPSERTVGKVAMLSLQYGAGAANFYDTAWRWGVENLTEMEAAQIVNTYRATFGGIVRAWDTCHGIMEKLLHRRLDENSYFMGLVQPVLDGPNGHPALKLVPTGTYIVYPNLRRQHNPLRDRTEPTYDTFGYSGGVNNLYGAKMFEQITQSLARNVVMEQTLAVDAMLLREVSPKCRTVMSVHDESVHIFPTNVTLAYDDIIERVEKIYGTSPSWWKELPVRGEVRIGDNYGECK